MGSGCGCKAPGLKEFWGPPCLWVRDSQCLDPLWNPVASLPRALIPRSAASLYGTFAQIKRCPAQ